MTEYVPMEDESYHNAVVASIRRHVFCQKLGKIHAVVAHVEQSELDDLIAVMREHEAFKHSIIGNGIWGMPEQNSNKWNLEFTPPSGRTLARIGGELMDDTHARPWDYCGFSMLFHPSNKEHCRILLRQSNFGQLLGLPVAHGVFGH